MSRNKPEPDRIGVGLFGPLQKQAPAENKRTTAAETIVSTMQSSLTDAL